ncbi:Crp/Fnr family transcriptional regulator [Undibacterium sp. Jales W-56]|uniref:Crp/Fnr family transcriptional regulator n=1 Tax=Undibacterium sp. Jales W-56 TaxID=2897325 RepID=UPI0021CFA983|nr:Crp/Fnr family transcriptional regulator [Undibacterium sp. Jales W-56]MCU6434895.1 Crp/Fnr family transcriptional regulator [Undibacterium sp. Jales W-56]
MNQAIRKETSITTRNVVGLKQAYASHSSLTLSSIGLRQNEILKNLDNEDLSLLLPHLEFVQLSFDQCLYEYGSSLSYVYFPTTAIVSLLYVLSDGGVTEISVIGHEGMVGMSALMGETALGNAVVQCAGNAYRLTTSALKQAYNRGGSLQQAMMRYTQALFSQMAQNCVCGRHYSIEQQLSRWILDRLDRLPTNELKVTHELIAHMLGVRRESITEAASKLQHAGLLQCRRGCITILDRKKLEEHAGECYKVAKHELDMLCCSSDLN